MGLYLLPSSQKPTDQVWQRRGQSVGPGHTPTQVAPGSGKTGSWERSAATFPEGGAPAEGQQWFLS